MVFLFKGSYKGFGLSRIGIGRIGIGEEGIVQGSSTGNLSQLRAVPAVATNDSAVNTQLTGLFNDFTNLFIITRNLEHIRSGSFNLGQNGFKIGVLL